MGSAIQRLKAVIPSYAVQFNPDYRLSSVDWMFVC